jgi:hypothetical protein
VISIDAPQDQLAAAPLLDGVDDELEVLAAGVELGVLDELSLEVLEPFDDAVSVDGVVEVLDFELDPRLSVL